MSENPITVSWLLSLPCVYDGRVIIDTRGVWPTARIGDTNARQIHTRNEFYFFIAEYLWPDMSSPTPSYSTFIERHVIR